MKKYFEVAKISFKNEIIYKFDVLMCVFFSIFKIILAFILWDAIYKENGQVSTYTFNQMITYYIFINFFSSIDKSDDMVVQISEEIKSGKFTKYLIVPVRIIRYFWFSVFAKSLFAICINAIVTAVFVVIFFNYISVQLSMASIFACILITILALTFTIFMNYFIGLLSFKFKNVNGFNMIKSIFLQFITGTLVPISMFPEIVKSIIKFSPFPYLYSSATTILLEGNLESFGLAVAVLLFWDVVMYLIAIMTFKYYRKEYEGVGV